MPFSIKRFTMHRSSSLPNQSPRPVEGKKLTLVEIRETSDNAKGSKKSGASSDGGSSKALPTSRSVDAAELRRMASLDADCGRPGSHRHLVEYPSSRQENAARQSQTLPNKFHKSRSLDHQRLYYEQVGGTEVRRLVLRRNGVRFQDSDWGTEESHSTSSSSGGGHAIRGHPVGPKPNEWVESDGHDPNGSRGSVRRSQPRRHHTLAGEHVSAASNTRLAMDLESHHLSAQRGPALYQPPPSVYDDDPGIMSEVETSATGFRRASKVRSSLPIVRTPSKTQERPLGLVFLQYRSETKRALLPNEITTLDTVRALFVRSFSKQLTMEYLDSPHIRIYIHDPSKDMFYELEDLREIRDRSVLRIYEQDANGGGVYSTYDQDMSYFSEPEFDSEYQNQHIHRAKGSKSQLPQSSNYYGTVGPYPTINRTQTLPHGSTVRPYSPAPVERPKSQPLPPAAVGFCQTLPRGMHLPSYTPTPLSPEKRQLDLLTPPGGAGQPPPKPQRSFQQSLGSKSVRSTPPPTGPPPSLPSSRSGQPRSLELHQRNVPTLSESHPMPTERRHEPQGAYRSTPERSYSAGQAYPSPERCYDPSYHSSPERRATHDSGYLSSPERRLDQQRSFSGYTSSSYDDSFYGERMYGSRSGSVTPVVDEEARIRVEFMERQLANLTGLVQKALASGSSQIPTRDTDSMIGKDKLERDGRGGKPAPPPKPASLSSSCSDARHYSPTKELHLGPELYSQLRYLRKQTKDLRLEVRNLRRMAQAQAVTARETVRDTCLKIKAMLAAAQGGEDGVCAERLRVSREEDLYRQDVNRLEKDLSELESQVEELRSNVINRRCRVNISDVESMALVLSRASKTVADLKARFPSLQESLKAVMAAEMEVVVREEKFLKEEPERLENALRRCKKLTGTLVTLKRLASVQEQRNTGGHHLPEKSASADSPHSDGEAHSARTIDSNPHTVIHVPPDGHQRALRTENALDALLDELQTFTKPSDHKNPQRRLPSYPSTDSPVRTPTHGPPAIPQKPAGGLMGRLQMAESGNRHSVTLSPSQSPVPDGKDVFSRVSVSSGAKHTVINGPETLPAPGPPLPAKKVPPPPPPRTTSRSPITSPTTTAAPHQHHPKKDIHIRSFSEPIPKNRPPSALQRIVPGRSASKEEEDELLRTSAISDDNLRRDQLSSNSSSSESVNSQEGLQMAMQGKGPDGKRSAPSTPPRTSRQDLLEQRHQELLRKQKQLQEQYARLQQLQRGQIRFSPPRTALGDLKKTGSESNILSKTALSLTPASGSLTHLAMNSAGALLLPKANAAAKQGKIFETDIL